MKLNCSTTSGGGGDSNTKRFIYKAVQNYSVRGRVERCPGILFTQAAPTPLLFAGIGGGRLLSQPWFGVLDKGMTAGSEMIPSAFH